MANCKVVCDDAAVFVSEKIRWAATALARVSGACKKTSFFDAGVEVRSLRGAVNYVA